MEGKKSKPKAKAKAKKCVVKSCGHTKTEATSIANKFRANGTNARLLKHKETGKYCVATCGKKKKPATKK